jgi:homoserine kinase type II
LGLLHTDPAPEHFRFDAARGACGLIDWSTGLVGPLLYDLASAVMYVGGPEPGRDLIDAYVDEAVVRQTEIERALPTMRRFRWAVQADYFARRIADNNLVGVRDAAENEKGLEDARRALAAPATFSR